VLRCVGNKLFINEFFGYGDDHVLGLMMWDYGYKSAVIPEITASHVGGLTFRKYGGTYQEYLLERNRIALSLVTNTRYRDLILLHALRNVITSILKSECKGYTYARVRALVDGMKLADRLRSKGIFINIYKAPLVKIPLKDLWIFFTRRKAIAKYFEGWITENLSFLTVE
jgi:GT2 family glycosyltransferase